MLHVTFAGLVFAAFRTENLNMCLCFPFSITNPHYCLDFQPPSGSTGQTNSALRLAKVDIRADAGCAAYSSAAVREKQMPLSLIALSTTLWWTLVDMLVIYMVVK